MKRLFEAGDIVTIRHDLEEWIKHDEDLSENDCRIPYAGRKFKIYSTKNDNYFGFYLNSNNESDEYIVSMFQEFENMIRSHEMWLRNGSGERLNLNNTDITLADFKNRNLSHSDFKGTYLEMCDFQGCKLVKADMECVLVSNDSHFEGADMQEVIAPFGEFVYVDFEDANLKGALLQNADLRFANLKSVNLEEADLSGAMLSKSDLTGANLKNADLSHAYLMDAKLDGADLSGANLEGVMTNLDLSKYIKK